MTIQPMPPLEHYKNIDSPIQAQSFAVLADDNRTAVGGFSVLSGAIHDDFDIAYNAFHGSDKTAAHSLLCVSENEVSALWHAMATGSNYLFLFIYELFAIIDDDELIQHIVDAAANHLQGIAFAANVKAADIAFFAEESNEFGFNMSDIKWTTALNNAGFRQAKREANVLFFPILF